MSTLLTAKDICVEFSGRAVLKNCTLGVNDSDRIGIVGSNGGGKSTLLRVLAGKYPPDSGMVIPSGNPTIGILGQTDSLVDCQSVGFSVCGDAPMHSWASTRSTREIVKNLIGDISWETQIGTLSGGQRRRVDLARLLIGSWDVLMLDEPTNHLDVATITWLAAHLKSRWTKTNAALLVVTHDRWFLDEVTHLMWEVHDGVLETFVGGFSAYIQQRIARSQAIEIAETKRQNFLRKELAWLSRGAQARATKPKFHVKEALALISQDPPLRNTVELKRAAMTRLGKQVLELKKLTVSFATNAVTPTKDAATNNLKMSKVLDEIDWIIGPGDRFGVLGLNGAGKTTLLNVLSGQLSPSEGTLKRGSSVKLSVLSQRLDELEAHSKLRVRELLAEHKTHLEIDGKTISTSVLLERLGFERSQLQSYVGDLSGGQKRRLQLLLILADEPNVLILDEPGNDMDTDMLAVLEDLLDGWPGTLILVSHDRYLMERVTDHQYALYGGKLTHMPKGVDGFLQLVKETKNVQLDENHIQNKYDMAKDKNAKSASTSNLHIKTTTALSGADAYKTRKQIATTMRKIEALELKVQEIDTALVNTDTCDYEQLIELGKQLESTKLLLAKQEELWFELSESLET